MNENNGPEERSPVVLKDVLNVSIAVFFFAVSGFLVLVAALAFYCIAPPRSAYYGEASELPTLERAGEPPLDLAPGVGGDRR